jgi:hypothetical protein
MKGVCCLAAWSDSAGGWIADSLSLGTSAFKLSLDGGATTGCTWGDVVAASGPATVLVELETGVAAELVSFRLSAGPRDLGRKTLRIFEKILGLGFSIFASPPMAED